MIPFDRAIDVLPLVLPLLLMFCFGSWAGVSIIITVKYDIINNNNDSVKYEICFPKASGWNQSNKFPLSLYLASSFLSLTHTHALCSVIKCVCMNVCVSNEQMSRGTLALRRKVLNSNLLLLMPHATDMEQKAFLFLSVLFIFFFYWHPHFFFLWMFFTLNT